MKKYLEEELKLNYLELCNFLQEKYGKPNGNYFLTESCKSKNNKITRGKEGLFLHHIKENEYVMLCNTEFAVKQSFEYQKSYNLVYCDYLEHLLLHIKIVEEYLDNSILKNGQHVGIGGITNFIVPEINDYFNGYQYQREWQKITFESVDKESFEELKKIAYNIIIKSQEMNYYKKHYGNDYYKGYVEFLENILLDGRGKMTSRKENE